MLKFKENKGSDKLTDQFEGLTEQHFAESQEAFRKFNERLGEICEKSAKEAMETESDNFEVDETEKLKVFSELLDTPEKQSIVLLQFLIRHFRESFDTAFRMEMLSQRFEEGNQDSND